MHWNITSVFYLSVRTRTFAFLSAVLRLLLAKNSKFYWLVWHLYCFRNKICTVEIVQRSEIWTCSDVMWESECRTKKKQGCDAAALMSASTASRRLENTEKERVSTQTSLTHGMGNFVWFELNGNTVAVSKFPKNDTPKQMFLGSQSTAAEAAARRSDTQRST